MNKLLLLLAFISPLLVQAQYDEIDQTDLLWKNNISKVIEHNHTDFRQCKVFEYEYKFDSLGRTILKETYDFDDGVREPINIEKFEYVGDFFKSYHSYSYLGNLIDSIMAEHFHDENNRLTRTSFIRKSHWQAREASGLTSTIDTAYTKYDYHDSTVYGYWDTEINEMCPIKSISFFDNHPNKPAEVKEMKYHDNDTLSYRVTYSYPQRGDSLKKEEYFNEKGKIEMKIETKSWNNASVEGAFDMTVYFYENEKLKSEHAYNVGKVYGHDIIKHSYSYVYDERGLLKQIFKKYRYGEADLTTSFEYE